jgi:cation diffusion facilitator family transporter
MNENLGREAAGKTSGEEEWESKIYKVAFLSLLVNVGLVGTKLFLSFVTGSLALRADSVHSSVDVFGSIMLIMGLFISRRKTRTFPYGLYKVENIVAIVISMLLFLTAYEIVNQACGSEGISVPSSEAVLLVVAAIIPVPLLFGRYEVAVGKKVGSPSLIADGNQFGADVLTSSLVFFGLLAQRFGLFWDRVVAVVIALFILRAGWGIMVGGMRVLLDASIDFDALGKIRSLIELEPAVSKVLDITARNSGRYLFVEAEVSMRITDLRKASMVSQRIEKNIRSNVPNIDRVLLHIEPQEKTVLRYVIPLADSLEDISHHFGTAPYFAMIDLDVKRHTVIRREIISNPHCDSEKGRGLKVAELLLGYKPDFVITRESLSKKGPGYAFLEAGVETLETTAERLRELVDNLVKEIAHTI